MRKLRLRGLLSHKTDLNSGNLLQGSIHYIMRKTVDIVKGIIHQELNQYAPNNIALKYIKKYNLKNNESVIIVQNLVYLSQKLINQVGKKMNKV